MDGISRSATDAVDLNPNASMFVLLAYRAVEDFSAEWWALFQSSLDPQNDTVYPDIIDPDLIPDVDALFDDFENHHHSPQHSV
ncbi:hypothetical protein DVH24_016861 [Malus domestica]|uniref:Ataxin-2 C-terminal domain-containing protein n=1 Tax=Malus domestica TaxID=3750 RepID=A0A498KNV3_MALDO|nr:hypothetical protein DVH24_016861 [Malus domestica]